MKGKLYGIGVGPGDPELMTLKAVRVINESAVVALPNKDKEKCVAYKIAKGAIPNIDEKEIININFYMTKDPELLKESHNLGADLVIEQLDAGKDVAFLTLGDPTVYSTYLYVHKIVLERGYDAEIISGIPSFCAASARLNRGLVEKSEELHVIPASYQIEESLGFPGTKVLMKSGSKISKVRDLVKERHNSAVMVENCGMENERIYENLDDVPEDASYYSLIIVKEE